MKVTAVELPEIPDTDSKEEQDAATAVDNTSNERVPSKLNVLGIWHQLWSVSYIHEHKRLNIPQCERHIDLFRG